MAPSLRAVRIVTGVAFFLFGFFVVANTLDLADREIVAGLVAGFIGGLTMLLTVVHEERGLGHCARTDVWRARSDIPAGV